MAGMNAGAGRREANKQATRNALSQAADRLFAERGYEATTVAQIAEAARVGERTFYRYFASKEDLLAGPALAWIDRLQGAIRARPAGENPYQAVTRAMTAVTAELARSEPGYETWIVSAPRPLAPLRRVEPRPMRRLEQSISEAVLARLDVAAGAGAGGAGAGGAGAGGAGAPGGGAASAGGAGAPGGGAASAGTPAAEFDAQLLARVAVAVLRNAILYRRTHPGGDDAGIERLLSDGFARLSLLAGPG
jgi:AcrR family transcriptional regulator